MNRGYTKEDYLSLVKKIRNKISDVSITTDIIVGFPGETEEEFQDTLDVVKESFYDNAYMFMYSKRSGTPAAIMENQIEDSVKKDRIQRLIEFQNKKSRENSELYLGKTVRVLVEGKTPKNEKMYTGRTDTNKVAIFAGDDSLIGTFVDVKITDIRTWTIYGEIQ